MDGSGWSVLDGECVRGPSGSPPELQSTPDMSTGIDDEDRPRLLHLFAWTVCVVGIEASTMRASHPTIVINEHTTRSRDSPDSTNFHDRLHSDSPFLGYSRSNGPAASAPVALALGCPADSGLGLHCCRCRRFVDWLPVFSDVRRVRALLVRSFDSRNTLLSSPKNQIINTLTAKL